jgi:hypothetical protein
MSSHHTVFSRLSFLTEPLDLRGGETWLLARRCRVSKRRSNPTWGGIHTHSSIDPYGSTESTRVDGELVSALLTWDSKVTTVVALLGGVTDLVRQRMKADGIYNDFVHIAKVCYSS